MSARWQVVQKKLVRDGLMDEARVTHTIKRRHCAGCGLVVLAALDEIGRRAIVDPDRLTPLGELQALTAGATTWADCGGAIVRRSVWRITRCRDERIHADHECGRPRDAFEAKPEMTRQGNVDSDIPPF